MKTIFVKIKFCLIICFVVVSRRLILICVIVFGQQLFISACFLTMMQFVNGCLNGSDR